MPEEIKKTATANTVTTGGDADYSSACCELLSVAGYIVAVIGNYLRAFTPGSSLPSMYSSKAPPPVDT